MYFWLKFFHIAAMTVWFTGLFFLPRLLVARHRAEADADRARFIPIAGTLFFRIMSPAALVTITLGMVLLGFGPSGAWLVMKLALVSLAVSAHMYFGVVLYELERGRDRHGTWFYRSLGWMPLALLLAIAALTGAKPQTVAPFPPPPNAAAADHSAAGTLPSASGAGGFSP
ncbi:MAG: CopD family protein [Pseudomonadota bacterium]|nr:CopD family protein [Pseudomonadota bacterium]